MFRSDYIYEIHNEEIIYIIDNNTGGKSVTNDMENVLDDIIGEGVDVEKYKIMYRDSEEIWDEVKLINTNPVEIDFSYIGESDFKEAVEVLQNR